MNEVGKRYTCATCDTQIMCVKKGDGGFTCTVRRWSFSPPSLFRPRTSPGSIAGSPAMSDDNTGGPDPDQGRGGHRCLVPKSTAIEPFPPRRSICRGFCRTLVINP